MTESVWLSKGSETETDPRRGKYDDCKVGGGDSNDLCDTRAQRVRLGVGILMIFVTHEPSDIVSETCTTEVPLLALLLICLLTQLWQRKHIGP